MSDTTGTPPDGPISVLAVSHQREMWGAERQYLGIAPGLVSRGVVITLAAPGGGSWLEAWRAAGLPGEALALPHHAGLRAPDGGRAGPVQLVREGAAVLGSAARVARLTRRHEIVMSFSLDGHVETVLAARLARRPSVVMLVDIVAHGMGRKVLQRATRLAHVTVVNSTATARTVGSNGEDDGSASPGGTRRRGRVVTLHPGVEIDTVARLPPDPAVRAGLGVGPDDLLVGIVGRLDEEKGVHTVIDAIRGLPSVGGRPVKLVVVGDVGTGPADYARALQEQAADLGERVMFAGRRDDVPDVVRSLDVLVNASRAEPFGLTVLEAQASGVAVVAARAGGIPDFVAEGETGLLFPPGDPVALRDALARALGDPAATAVRVEKAHRQAVERFDVGLQFDRYATLLKGLVAPRPGGRP